MKKYLAIGRNNWLGTKHNTREEAEFAIKKHNAALDSWTGYCHVRGEFTGLDDGYVYEYDDESIITKEEFDKAMAEMEQTEEELKKEIAKLREEKLGKYWQIAAIYHNQVPYQSEDILRITARQKFNHRRKITEGRVYESVFNDDGELRPAIASHKNRYVPDDHYIESIEIIGNERDLPNAHCTNSGKCKHLTENNECGLLKEYLNLKK